MGSAHTSLLLEHQRLPVQHHLVHRLPGVHSRWLGAAHCCLTIAALHWLAVQIQPPVVQRLHADVALVNCPHLKAPVRAVWLA